MKIEGETLSARDATLPDYKNVVSEVETALGDLKIVFTGPDSYE